MLKQTHPIFIILLLNLQLLFGDNYIRLKTGIHFDSQVSGGKYSLAELTNIIGQSDLDVAIITDHDNMTVRYGFPFFNKAFQIPVKRQSIATIGVDYYFDKINRLNRFYPDVEIIPGIEAVPYYSWHGSFFKGNLSLQNWHRHLLVFGMDNIKAYEKLPSLAQGFPRQHSIGQHMSHFFFYYLILILLGLIFIWLLLLCIGQKRITILRGLLFICLLYILIVEIPYQPSVISPYNPATSKMAFQSLIDHVNTNNGLIFWAHPEAEYQESIQSPISLFQPTIDITTQKYSHLVYETENHTGFAGFWEGMNSLGNPGRLWDRALQDYCNGTQKSPFFTIGELDFEGTNNLDLINETNTFIFATNKSRNAIFDALRHGRMYMTRNFLGDKLVIDTFKAYNLKDETSAIMGETLLSGNSPIAINIKISVLESLDSQSFTLYRNDTPIQQFEISKSVDKWFIDKSYPPHETFYYKLYAGGDWIELVTNPIFVKSK